MSTELKAPEGKYRVVGVDTFDNTDWVEMDTAYKHEAIEAAEKRGGTMLKMHVYDDQGRHVAEGGTF